MWIKFIVLEISKMYFLLLLFSFSSMLQPRCIWLLKRSLVLEKLKTFTPALMTWRVTYFLKLILNRLSTCLRALRWGSSVNGVLFIVWNQQRNKFSQRMRYFFSFLYSQVFFFKCMCTLPPFPMSIGLKTETAKENSDRFHKYA